jgi:hypothetical protein
MRNNDKAPLRTVPSHKRNTEQTLRAGKGKLRAGRVRLQLPTGLPYRLLVPE